MASAAVKERLNRQGQGVLQPSAGLAALAAVLRSAASGSVSAAGNGVVTVNPFRWSTYLQHMQVRSAFQVGVLTQMTGCLYGQVSKHLAHRTVNMVLAAPLLLAQGVPEVYTELDTRTGKAAAAGATEPAPAGSAWTPDKIAAEVQSALQEVLGRALEPDEPFMSGVCMAGSWKSQPGACRFVLVFSACLCFLPPAVAQLGCQLAVGEWQC